MGRGGEGKGEWGGDRRQPSLLGTLFTKSLISHGIQIQFIELVVRRLTIKKLNKQ